MKIVNVFEGDFVCVKCPQPFFLWHEKLMAHTLKGKIGKRVTWRFTYFYTLRAATGDMFIKAIQCE